MSELLPCPFCGGEAEFQIFGNICNVACAECHIGTRYESLDSVEQVVAAWNTRAERTCRIAYRDDSYDTDAGFEYDGSYYCDECLRDLPDCVQDAWDDYQAGRYGKPIERCPRCGAKITEVDK